MTLTERIDAYKGAQPVGLMLDDAALLNAALEAVTRYAGYAGLASSTQDAPAVLDGQLVLDDGEWAIIFTIFRLYVERATAEMVEMTRGSGLDVFCRTVAEVEQDIRAALEGLPELAFCEPVVSFA